MSKILEDTIDKRVLDILKERGIIVRITDSLFLLAKHIYLSSAQDTIKMHIEKIDEKTKKLQSQ